MGFSWSEVSRRYISSRPEFYYPEPVEWRKSAENVKQGSSIESLEHHKAYVIDEDVNAMYGQAYCLYEDMLEEGVCPEQARMILPQAMYTTTVTTGTLLGWHHLYKLRTEKHTQQETQEYARAIGEMMKELFPISWEALCKHS